MDSNWFCSALAQSAASLSGFIGAFIIAAIINNHMSFKKNCERIGYLLSESERLRSTIQAILKSGKKIYKSDDLDIDLHKHIRSIENVLSNVKSNPESSSLITFTILSLILLFFVGVIYPLSFLLIDPSSILQFSFSVFFVDTILSMKSMMLIAVSVIFIVIALVFLTINIRLRYNTKQITKLKLYSQSDIYY